MRQRLKSRINPRGRPHLKQRRTVREENFGFRSAFTIIDFFAMLEILSEFTSLEALTPAQISKKFRRVVKTIVASSLVIYDARRRCWKSVHLAFRHRLSRLLQWLCFPQLTLGSIPLFLKKGREKNKAPYEARPAYARS